MSLLRVTIRGVRAVIREIKRARRELERIEWRILTHAARDISRLFARHIQAVIDERTTRDTGNLRRVKVKIIRLRNQGTIRFLPQFPHTAYKTPFGRGRRGASKIGQYAFVVNHNKRFIQEAIVRTENDPQLLAILRKHRDFIVSQINQGR